MLSFTIGLIKKLNLLQMFQRSFCEKHTDVCCEISALFRIFILKNNQGQQLHYCFFYQVRLSFNINY